MARLDVPRAKNGHRATRRAVWPVLAVFLLFALRPLPAAGQNEVAFASNVVQILLRDEARGTSEFVGSGVLVAPSYILTARHLFLDQDRQPRVDPHLRPRGVVARIEGSNESYVLSDLVCEGGGGAVAATGGGVRDLCVLHINPTYTRARGVTRFPAVGCNAPELHEQLWASGWIQVRDNPEPNLVRGLEGRVVAERQPDRRLQTSHQLVSAMSGGGLFDATGRLRAITSDGFGQGNLSRVVATDEARQLLDQRNVNCAPVTRAGGASASDPEPFERIFGRRDVQCQSGLEIKDSESIIAPSGRYFTNLRIEELNFSTRRDDGDNREWPTGCNILARDTQRAPGTDRIIQIRGFARADCGSGLLVSGSISARCRFTAETLPLR